MSEKTKYQIQESDGSWVDVQRAVTETRWLGEKGGLWLRYELRDGTIGLKKPGTWRIKPLSAGK